MRKPLNPLSSAEGGRAVRNYSGLTQKRNQAGSLYTMQGLA